MIPELRELFNSTFTERRYRTCLDRLDYRCRTQIAFRVCETPFFIPKQMQQQCERAAIELTLQAHSPEYLKISDATLAPEYTVANQDERSTFMVVDFAMTTGADGKIVPKLIELQGFPSLMAYQLVAAEHMIEHYRLPTDLEYINGGHSRNEFRAILRDAIIADEDPENVVLMDLDPWNQKTHPDFIMQQELTGVQVVDIRNIIKVGRKLHYEHEGRRIPINRIFNRAIVDEINRRNIELPFNWNDDLDVTWAGHPNWYFRISKYTIPYLDHPMVPQAHFLDQIDELPENLEDFVLKPLYSFAGTGVIVSPTREDINAIPAEHRGHFLLQERVNYGDVIKTPEGGTKAEARFMLIWLPDEPEPRVVMGLTRMGRGKMMGVDYNANIGWIGAAVSLYG